MNLVRLGHYFTPRGSGDGLVEGACQTALVCGPGDVAEHNEVTLGSGDTGPLVVNLHIWRHDGVSLGVREGVPVAEPADGGDSFHLSGDCPWKK